MRQFTADRHPAARNTLARNAGDVGKCVLSSCSNRWTTDACDTRFGTGWSIRRGERPLSLRRRPKAASPLSFLSGTNAFRHMPEQFRWALRAESGDAALSARRVRHGFEVQGYQAASLKPTTDGAIIAAMHSQTSMDHLPHID